MVTSAPLVAARPDFKLNRVMASLFFAGKGLNPQTALRQVLRDWPSVYDGEVISLPFEADKNVPSIIVSNKDGSLRVELSRNRANLIWISKDEAQVNLSEVLQTFSSRLAAIRDEDKSPVNRLGAVVERVANLKDPGHVLASYFCRRELLTGPLKDPKGFELHVHTVVPLLSEIQANLWTRIRASKGSTSEYQYVVAIQDMNTLAEESEVRTFTPKQTVDFYIACIKEFDAFLDHYFSAEFQVGLNL